LSQQRYKQDQPLTQTTLNSFVYGNSINDSTSLEVAAFYRGLFFISSQVAKMPWDIKTFDNKVVNNNNDVYDLLNISPNDDMSAFNWKVLCTQIAILQGNCFNEIVRTRSGKIHSIIPMLNYDVCMVRDGAGKLFYQISNTNDESESVVYLRKDEVLHFRNIHTEDGINGMSLINHASKSLGLAAGADRMAGNIFGNGGLPSGVLETERVLSPEVIERLKVEWKNKFGGNKSGGVAVLEEGMKFNPLNFAPDVLQFLDSRKYSVLEIARFLGVPPSKLYVLEAQSYNNIEHSNLEVSNDTIDVWAKNFEGEVNMKLLNSKVSKLKSDMDLYAINRGDMDKRSSYFQKMIGSGAMSPNEIRRKEGMAIYEGGDEYYISTNNLTPISRQDEIIDSQIKQKDTVDKNSKADDDLKAALAKKINKK